MENDKCTVHLQLAWQWNFVHVAVILGNSSRLEGEGTSQQKNTSLISRHPDLEPCSSFSLVGPVSSLYLQCWGFSSYSFSCHLRPHSLVSGELIKKGRLRWWDAQLKKHRWSWHENRRAGHAFIFGDHVGLCMPENNSGIPPHLRSTTSPVILTWATRKQTTVFNVTCRVWARPGTSQAWGPQASSLFLVCSSTFAHNFKPPTWHFCLDFPRAPPTQLVYIPLFALTLYGIFSHQNAQAEIKVSYLTILILSLAYIPSVSKSFVSLQPLFQVILE